MCCTNEPRDISYVNSFFCFGFFAFLILVILKCVCLQIIIPRFHQYHHTVYVMNRYTGSLDIFDSMRYSGQKDTTRSAHHEDRVEIVCKLFLLHFFPFFCAFHVISDYFLLSFS